MIDLPDSFPHLPQHARYPTNFLVAHDKISNVYRHALQVSAQEDADPLQLIFHCDAVTNTALPLLEAIGEDPAVIEPVLGDWLIVATMVLGMLSKRLADFRASLGNR